MNRRAMLNRLSALEGRAGAPDRLSLIEVAFINCDGTEAEPMGYRDYDGGAWMREPDETLDAFKARAAELARKASKRGIGVLIPLVSDVD